MTNMQIKYFLTAARCLNFTEAAKQLYITQPALSQQISALEKELNMQLFVRARKKVFLTPAAVVLLQELPKYEKHYADIMDQARFANEGTSGVLKLAFIEGQYLSEQVLSRIQTFREEHPNIALDVTCRTFVELRQMLEKNETDIIYTADFEVQENPLYLYEPVAEDYAVLLMSKREYEKHSPIHSISDLRGETFLFLRSGEGENVNPFILQDFKNAGFIPNVRYVDSPGENILLTELGLGVAITNSDSYGRRNPNIVELDLRLATRNFVFGWKKTNENPALALFMNYFLET